MARLSDDEVEEIVQRAHPGATVVRRPDAEGDSGSRPAVDVDGVSIQELRDKYLGTDAGGGDAGLEAAAADDLDDPQQVLVDIEYDDHGTPVTKTVVVSAEDREVIGEQG